MVNSAAAETRVVKKLVPGQGGALKWSNRYGPALVCVRYRLSADGSRRFTTVELTVDEAPTQRSRQNEVLGVRVGIEEGGVRAKVKAAGGSWDPQRKVWRLARRAVKRLGLLDRVVEQ